MNRFASLVVLGLFTSFMVACGGAPTAEAPTAEAPAAEVIAPADAEAPAADAEEPASDVAAPPMGSNAPLLPMPAGTELLTEDYVTKEKLPIANSETSQNFYGDVDFDSALADMKAQYTAAGYTISDESSEKPGMAVFKATGPATGWTGMCVVSVAKAPEGDPGYAAGYTKLSGLILCDKK